MDEVQRETRRIITLVLIIAIIPVFGLLWSGNWGGLRGFLLGFAVNIITFLMLARSAWQITGAETETQGQVLAVVNYLMRLIFYGLTLVVAFTRPDINAAATVIGMVMIKYTLIGEGLVKHLFRVAGGKIGSVEE